MTSLPVVLHVDDDCDDRELFARAFARSGLRAELVSLPTAQAAVLYISRLSEYAAAPRPRLVVLDYDMPWMNGKGLVGFIRNTGDLADVPIVLLSGSSAAPLPTAGSPAGVSAFVSKPQTVERLAEVIGSFSRWLGPDGRGGGASEI